MKTLLSLLLLSSLLFADSLEDIMRTRQLALEKAQKKYCKVFGKATATAIKRLKALLKIKMAAYKLEDAVKIKKEIEALEKAKPPFKEKSPGQKKSGPTIEFLETKNFTINKLENGSIGINRKSWVWKDVPSALHGWNYTRNTFYKHGLCKYVVHKRCYIYLAKRLNEKLPLGKWRKTRMSFYLATPRPTKMTVYRRAFRAGEIGKMDSDCMILIWQGPFKCR